MSKQRLAKTLAAALVLAVAPAVGSAQQSDVRLVGDLPSADQVRVRAEAQARETEAEELYRKAKEAEEKDEWSEAARLYTRSAALRPAGDRLGSKTFEVAGRAYLVAGDSRRASTMLERAADGYLVVGDVHEAARSYLGAAMAARAHGNRIRAVEIGWKAYHLSRSELLTSDQRKVIQEQLEVDSGQPG